MKLIIILPLLIVLKLSAQVDQEWIQRYNGSGNSTDEPGSLAVDNSGNVYVTGQSIGINMHWNCVTIKYNSEGKEIWRNEYDGAGVSDDHGIAIATDKSGNVYIAAETGIFGVSRDYLTIKYNTSGIQQWAVTYNGPGNSTDSPLAITLDDSANVYVTGYSWGVGTTTDYATIKYDSAGVQKWVSRYDGPGSIYDIAHAIAVDTIGNIYVTGESVGNGTNNDIATIKYNSAGDQLWVQRYHNNGTSDERAYSICVNKQNMIYVAGSTDGDGTSTDFVTIKYNSSGIEQWMRKYNGPGYQGVPSADSPSSIIADDMGNVFVAGFSTYALGESPYEDFTTIKYNPSGDEEWIKYYNGPADNSSDFLNSIALDATGNIYVTGQSEGIGTGTDYATIKYSTNGEEQWVQRYNGPGNAKDMAMGIAIDSMDNVFITGASQGNGSEYDYTTIKYSQSPSDVNSNTELQKNNFILDQNYPNPFNTSTKISYEIPVRNKVMLKIYDVLGNEVATLISEEKPAGNYEINFNGQRFTSGIYYYQLKAGNFSQTKKMTLSR